MRAQLVLSQAFKGLARDKGMALAIALVMYVSILFVGGGALLRMQVSQMESQWYDKIEVTVFMCAENDTRAQCNEQAATQDQVEDVRKSLESDQLKPVVKEVIHVSQEEAFKNFKEIFGDSAIARQATPDMLGESFRVKLVDPNQFRIIREEFQSRPGVAVVSDQRQIVEPLLIALNRAAYLAWGLAAIMTVAAVLLITTTIRLFAMSRERETTIMRLVGASNLFIQAPFIVQSAIAALVGAAFAIGTLFFSIRTVVQAWLVPSFPWSSFVGYQEVGYLTPVLVIVSLIFVAIAAAISLAKYTKV
ncbi:permease-like cell division protein FtsX [Boudabousia marimammalium]|uniref:Cell division protein FtsX n=1 Tax=Boudabousia marimammalium TaxID=156892 RepID=A0A1Q5PM02_9ACTO|nr:permease-like cell division protein FtsX [Boudabousia marimammalium]OKL48088.1 cell division protein FtsX [Boudabousia marimammalium]